MRASLTAVRCVRHFIALVNIWLIVLNLVVYSRNSLKLFGNFNASMMLSVLYPAASQFQDAVNPDIISLSLPL